MTELINPKNREASQEAPLHSFLFYFLRLGALGFGGPIALVGYMQRDLVEGRRWISRDDFLEGLALAQLAPGPLAAQLAIYLGYLRAGFWGATLVGFAFILPSFLMVLGLSAAYVRYGGLPWMQALFYGIGAAVIGIITRSAAKLIKSSLGSDPLLWIIFSVLAVSTAVTGKEIIWLFLLGGLIPLFIRIFRERTAGRSLPRLTLVLTVGALPLTNRFFEIFLYFSKAGLFVFGSGLAIVPFLYGGVVQQHHWLNDRQFIDAVAVAMITPGPVVITVAFIGYLVGGLAGATAAALGVFLPVYLVVVILGPYYKAISKDPRVSAFAKGVTAAAVGAIAGAVVVLARRSLHDLPTVAIGVGTLILLLRWKIPEPLIILAAALLGLALYRG
ncbi:MAG: chromate transporter [Acidobacteriia bacterium]|nr:chromate transporter [Terriglobia bacterium]